MVATPFSTVSSVVGSNPTWDNALYDPKTVVLSLGVLRSHYMYIRKAATQDVNSGMDLHAGVVFYYKNVRFKSLAA